MLKNNDFKLIRVTELNQADFKKIHDEAYMNDPEGFALSFRSVYSGFKFENYCHYFIFKYEGKNVGVGYLSWVNWKVLDCTMYITKTHRNNGIGTIAKASMLKEAFYLGYEQVHSSVVEINEASKRVNEKLGGEEIGFIEDRYFMRGKLYKVIKYRFNNSPYNLELNRRLELETRNSER